MASNSNDETIVIGRMSLPNFEISWAGGSPGRPGYWFGSDDGRIQFIGLGDAGSIGPFAVSPSREAINGIAFAGGLMAVSTRNDVTCLTASDLGGEHVEPTVYPGGAHGVIGTSSGGLAAPMGRRGVLLISPDQRAAQG